jgi:phage FluMu protein Com
MALRFRCEHCGKRLQVDVEPGVMVACPYCRNTVTVPADAQTYDQGQAQAPQQGEAEEEMEETTGDAVVAFMATYLPSWGTSVVLHLALILICLMSVWATQKEPEVIEYTSQTEIKKERNPKREMKRSAPKSRTTRRAVTSKVSSFAYKKTNNPNPDIASHSLRPVDTIGLGGGGGDFGGLSGFGDGRGGGGGGSDFFGVGGVAERVVYVVDRSGSMTDSIMYVKYELRRSIRALKPNQKFYVVFYSTGPASGMPSGKLVPATEPNKLSAYEFIDSIVPVGQTDPSQALDMAFKTGPEVVYLLTDGEFDKKIVGLIDKLNRGKKVSVHTFCFIYTGGEAILQQIAKNNDGEYKYIGEDDLESLGR